MEPMILGQSILANTDQVYAFLKAFPALFIALIVWSIVWKGFALWKAARLSHKWWFIIFLVVNTVGILEIIYIFMIARRYNVTEIKEESVPKE